MKTTNLKTYTICLMALCAMPQLHAAQAFTNIWNRVFSRPTVTTKHSTSNDELHFNIPQNYEELERRAAALPKERKQAAINNFNKRKHEYEARVAKNNNNHGDVQNESNTKEKKISNQSIYPNFDIRENTMKFG